MDTGLRFVLSLKPSAGLSSDILSCSGVLLVTGWFDDNRLISEPRHLQGCTLPFCNFGVSPILKINWCRYPKTFQCLSLC